MGPDYGLEGSGCLVGSLLLGGPIRFGLLALWNSYPAVSTTDFERRLGWLLLPDIKEDQAPWPGSLVGEVEPSLFEGLQRKSNARRAWPEKGRIPVAM